MQNARVTSYSFGVEILIGGVWFVVPQHESKEMAIKALGGDA